MKSRTKSFLITTAVCSSLFATPAIAEKANELGGISGSTAAEAERALGNRGFEHTSSHRSSGGYTSSYWWDEGTDDCVVVGVYNRTQRVESINDATDQDCGHHNGSAGTAVAAVAGAAILGALLSHRSHHREGRDYDETQTAEFERGYTDGLHNASYHNRNRDDAYAHGYERGVDEREANLSHHQRRGGYSQDCPSDLRGNECEYYKDGYRAGAQDGSAGMSMAYERHDGYDSRFEPYFARGYTDGWRANRGVGSSNAVQSATPARYDDLNGRNGRQARDILSNRGFTRVARFGDDSTRYSIMWRATSRQCLELMIVNGNVQNIRNIGQHPNCR